MKLIAFLLSILITLSVTGKTLKVALDADPVSLDIHVQLSGGMLQLSHWIFDPLVRWKKDMTFEPRLATSWKRINKTKMRFYLRKGVVFHSGNPFTAKDVKWTLERLKKSGDFKGLFEPFKTIKVINKHTVDIITKKPYALLLNMATYIFAMDSKFYTGKDKNGKPKDWIDKTAPTFAASNESGTGKYYVVEKEQGIKLVLKKFDKYWNKAGNIDKIILTPIKNDATRVAALLSGDVDFISPVPPQDYPRIKRNKKNKLVTMSGSRIITLQLNQKRNSAFKKTKVRQAMVYAINNVAIVQKIMKGTASVAAQQAPEGFAGYVKELKPRYDLSKAKKLMKEANMENGFKASMICPNNRYVNDEKICEAVVSMLAKINIKVSLKTMPKAQYWDEFDLQASDMQMIGWHADSEDSANFTEFLLMTKNKKSGYGQYNSGNYSNKKVDKLVIKSQTETNVAKRNKILQEVERILYNDAAFLPFHWQNLSWAGKANMNVEDVVNKQNFIYFGDLVIK